MGEWSRWHKPVLQQSVIDGNPYRVDPECINSAIVRVLQSTLRRTLVFWKTRLIGQAISMISDVEHSQHYWILFHMKSNNRCSGIPSTDSPTSQWITIWIGLAISSQTTYRMTKVEHTWTIQAWACQSLVSLISCSSSFSFSKGRIPSIVFKFLSIKMLNVGRSLSQPLQIHCRRNSDIVCMSEMWNDSEKRVQYLFNGQTSFQCFQDIKPLILDQYPSRIPSADLKSHISRSTLSRFQEISQNPSRRPCFYHG
jgi:hypothetical protein